MPVWNLRRRLLLLLAPLPVFMGIQYVEDPERVLFIAVIYLAGVACGMVLSVAVPRYFGGLPGLVRAYYDFLLRFMPVYVVERPALLALVTAWIVFMLVMALVAVARIVGMVLGAVMGVDGFS